MNDPEKHNPERRRKEEDQKPASDHCNEGLPELIVLYFCVIRLED